MKVDYKIILWVTEFYLLHKMCPRAYAENLDWQWKTTFPKSIKKYIMIARQKSQNFLLRQTPINMFQYLVFFIISKILESKKNQRQNLDLINM